MKKNYYLVILLTALVCGNAQNFRWVKSIKVPADAKGVLTDAGGKVYVYGGLIPEGSFYNYDGLATDNTGSFLTKLDTDGNVLYTKHWKQALFIQDMVAEGSSIYFTGMFYGLQSVDGHTIESQGRSDGFAGKMDLEGNVVWLTSFGGHEHDFANGITVRADKSGVLLTGGVASELFVNGTSKETFTWRNTLVLELDANGSYVRHKLFDFYPDQPGESRGSQIEADENGNYLLKCFQKGTPWNDLPGAVPYLGLYVYKLNAQLDTVWTTLLNTTGNYGYKAGDLSCSPEGDAYLPHYYVHKYGGDGLFDRLSASGGQTVWTLPTKDSYYTSTFYGNNNIYFIGMEGAYACPCPDATQGYPVIKSYDRENQIRYSVKVEGISLKAVTADQGGLSAYVVGRFRSAPFTIGGQVVEGEILDYYPYEGTFVASLEDVPTIVPEPRAGTGRFSVFPSPSDGRITITMEQRATAEQIRIKVLNLYGQQVFNATIGKEEASSGVQLNLSGAQAGLYVVEVVQGEQRYIRQIAIR